MTQRQKVAEGISGLHLKKHMMVLPLIPMLLRIRMMTFLSSSSGACLNFRTDYLLFIDPQKNLKIR